MEALNLLSLSNSCHVHGEAMQLRNLTPEEKYQMEHTDI